MILSDAPLWELLRGLKLEGLDNAQIFPRIAYLLRTDYMAVVIASGKRESSRGTL